MAIRMVCTISIENYPYEGGVEAEEIFKVSTNFSSTGSFAKFDKSSVGDWLENIADDTKSKALRKLDALKGDG